VRRQGVRGRINFIDTANVYSRGAAESLLGEVLAGPARATRTSSGQSSSGRNGDRGLSREQVLQAARPVAAEAEDGVRRPVPVPPLRLRDTPARGDDGGAARGRAGQARRAISASASGRPTAIEAASSCRASSSSSSSQPQYSMPLARARARGVPALRANGISQIVWSPLAQGALTGKYKPGERRRGHARARRRTWAGRWTASATTTCSRRCSGSADRRRARHHDGAARARVGPASREVACAIVGASRPEQVEDNARRPGSSSTRRRCGDRRRGAPVVAA
jgi:aryl-alcohol dehydrogenase-like predicted oxidoreductase